MHIHLLCFQVTLKKHVAYDQRAYIISNFLKIIIIVYRSMKYLKIFDPSVLEKKEKKLIPKR